MPQETPCNIAIVDDNRMDSWRLQNGIHTWFGGNNLPLENITCFPDGSSLLKAFEAEKFQIVFMDIIMDSLSGIDTARKLRDTGSNALIIFTTSSRDYAFDTFPLHPFDYLVKPCSQERLDYVLREAVKVIEAPEPFLSVRVSRSVYKIPLRKISVVLSNDHFVEVVMSDGNCLLCSMTFHEVETSLMNYSRFLMCNRGVIINMDCVSSLSRDKSSMIMNNGSQYPIRVHGKMELISTFTQYQISRMRGACRL